MGSNLVLADCYSCSTFAASFEVPTAVARLGASLKFSFFSEGEVFPLLVTLTEVQNRIARMTGADNAGAAVTKAKVCVATKTVPATILAPDRNYPTLQIFW